MFRLSTTKMISSAHVLRNYDGPCGRLHGHNWHIKMDVLAGEVDDTGLAIDFKEMDDLLWEVIAPYDHAHFNDFPPFDTINPSAENIAREVFRQLKQKLPAHIRLEKITVWETENYLVEYFE